MELPRFLRIRPKSFRIVPRFLLLSKPYFTSEKRWQAGGLLALLLMLMLANLGASVYLNQ